MNNNPYTRLRQRLAGLAKVIGDELNDPNQSMTNRERKDLSYLHRRMTQILKDDQEAQDTYIRLKGLEDEEMPCPHSNQYLNTQCEFFDIDSNRIQCAIGWDMYRCNSRCLFATNTPGSLPPYGTKYMKGRL